MITLTTDEIIGLRALLGSGCTSGTVNSLSLMSLYERTCEFTQDIPEETMNNASVFVGIAQLHTDSQKKIVGVRENYAGDVMARQIINKLKEESNV